MRILLACMAISLATASAAQTTIAVSEWVNPNAWQVTTSGDARVALDPFNGLQQNVRLETDRRGAIDVLFERGSRLLVGPDCDLTLDETLYDPSLDEVVGFDLYSDTVCVVRTGARGETIVLETPIAVVTIDHASATIRYLNGGDDRANGPRPETGTAVERLSRTQPGPGQAGDAQPSLIVLFNQGFDAGGGSVVVRPLDGRGSVTLFRPGFLTAYTADRGLSEPRLARPEDTRALEPELAAPGDDAASVANLVQPPSFAEVERMIRSRTATGLPGACTSGDFCDTATAGSDFGSPITFP